MSECHECLGRSCGQVGQAKCEEQMEDHFDDSDWDDCADMCPEGNDCAECNPGRMEMFSAMARRSRMPATKEEVIRWQLKCLVDERENLSESELNLITSFEEQFKRNHSLSDRQMEVLESIYERHA